MLFRSSSRAAPEGVARDCGSERRAERLLIQRIESRETAENARAPNRLDSALSVGVGVADENDSLYRNASSAQRFERQQAVIDCAEARACDKNDGHMPALKHIDCQRAIAERRHRATRRFYHERTVARRRVQRRGVDFDAFVTCGEVR